MRTFPVFDYGNRKLNDDGIMVRYVGDPVIPHQCLELDGEQVLGEKVVDDVGPSVVGEGVAHDSITVEGVLVVCLRGEPSYREELCLQQGA